MAGHQWLADSLAESALKIAESDISGLFHVAGLSCESRFEFCQKLAQEFGYDQNLIQPTDSSQFKQKAKRPSYSCLDSTKAIETFGINLHTTEDSLKIMKSQVEKEAPHLLGPNQK
jgi:dTDP-4-dehydrorhamnose reductase